MITVPEALARLLEAAAPAESIVVPLESARGRILTEDVLADRDAPPSDRSAMDGFAVRAADLASPPALLRVADEVRAGESAAGVRVEPGACVRIFTGAVVPEGADAVVMVERAEEDRPARHVRLDDAPAPGQHIRRAGEDVHAGDVVVPRGRSLRPAEIAALAAVGRETVSVLPAPRVAVLSTGDEIVAAGRSPLPHQVRNSNAAMLLALVAAEGLAAVDLGIAPDDPGRLAALLIEGLRFDVLLVSGGVSVGEYDLVERELTARGAQILFHTVSMRPGKPILAARCGEALVLGLPGNPVSAFTAFHVFAAPALRSLAGHPEPVRAPQRARLTRRLARRPGRLTYALGRLEPDGFGLAVTPVPSASSGDLFALARADAFVVVEGGDQPVEAGETVDVLPWD